MKTEFKTLRNGVKIPAIGYGTYLAGDGKKGAEGVKCAVEAGYRLIDCAAKYGNEQAIGEGLRESGVKRTDLFVTSKVWSTERGYESTLRSFESSLTRLGLDYLDLFLIHWPASPSRYPDWEEINLLTWRALERLYHEGRVRAIGVSNFMPHHLRPLMESAEVLPMVNQIEYHPGFMQEECVNYCQRHDIHVEAWSPLGRGKMLGNEVLERLAAKYGRSVAQICLRWELQNGIIPLPKSVTPQRISENFEVFDFTISAEDMREINALPTFGTSGLDPDTVNF